MNDDDKQLVEIKHSSDQEAAMLAGMGALCGAGVGALIGFLIARPDARKKIFSSYSEIKNKSIEVYNDVQKFQKAREKHEKTRYIKDSNE